jgi:hypothetical protein
MRRLWATLIGHKAVILLIAGIVIFDLILWVSRNNPFPGQVVAKGYASLRRLLRFWRPEDDAGLRRPPPWPAFGLLRSRSRVAECGHRFGTPLGHLCASSSVLRSENPA